MATFPRRRRLYRLLALGDTDVSPEALARDERRLRLLSILSIPAAVLVHSVTAWILGLVKSQPGWHTAILAPLFIVSAIVSGVALTALAGLVSRNLLHIRVCDHAIDALGRILCFSIPVLAYFLVAELLTEIYPREPSALHVMRETIVGRYAPVFWFQIFASLVVPFVILASRRLRTTTGVGIASLLVVLGVLAERWNIVIPPLTGHTYLPYAMAGYAPTFLELALTLGVYAGGVLVYLVVTRLLPMVRLDVEQGARP
jgi:molybdopterin-containing oxidoreductase family membrane subunit